MKWNGMTVRRKFQFQLEMFPSSLSKRQNAHIRTEIHKNSLNNKPLITPSANNHMLNNQQVYTQARVKQGERKKTEQLKTRKNHFFLVSFHVELEAKQQQATIFFSKTNFVYVGAATSQKTKWNETRMLPPMNFMDAFFFFAYFHFNCSCVCMFVQVCRWLLLLVSKIKLNCWKADGHSTCARSTAQLA